MNLVEQLSSNKINLMTESVIESEYTNISDEIEVDLKENAPKKRKKDK